MPIVKFIWEPNVKPSAMMFLLSPLVLADDPDAQEMARKGKFEDPVFDVLRHGVMAHDLDVLAESICSYLPDAGYSACRQMMIEKIATASYRKIIADAQTSPFGATDVAQRVVQNIIGDARLDRWIGYSIIREEIELLRESMGAFSRADERRVSSWLAAAKRTAETGQTTTPSVLFKSSDRTRAGVAGGEAIALAWSLYAFAENERRSATQNASFHLARRIQRMFDRNDMSVREEMLEASTEAIAQAVGRAILSFPQRQR